MGSELDDDVIGMVTYCLPRWLELSVGCLPCYTLIAASRVKLFQDLNSCPLGSRSQWKRLV